MNLFYTPQIVTAFVCTDNITLGYCTRWIRPEGPRHIEKTSRGWSCAVAERAHGKEHGDAHECSKSAKVYGVSPTCRYVAAHVEENAVISQEISVRFLTDIYAKEL